MANQMLAYRRSCWEQIIPISEGHRIRRQQQYNAIICWTEALGGLHITFILTDGFVVGGWQHARDKKNVIHVIFQKMYRVQCTFSTECMEEYSWCEFWHLHCQIYKFPIKHIPPFWLFFDCFCQSQSLCPRAYICTDLQSQMQAVI